MNTIPGTEKLAKRFVRMFKCDTARITKPCDHWFLVIGWNRNTKKDREEGRSSGQWVRNGEPIDFDYVHEEVIANGANEKELIASAKHYKKLSGMTWEQIFKKGFKWAFPTLCILLCSCQFAAHESHSSATKWEKDTLLTLGGTTHTTGADGFDNATDHNASFQVGAQTLGAGYAAGRTAATQASNNAKDAAINASNNTAATQQALNASNAATAQAQISANAAKVAGQQANAVQLSTILKKGPPAP